MLASREVRLFFAVFVSARKKSASLFTKRRRFRQILPVNQINNKNGI